MTKLTFITAVLMAFSISLTSCKKDDDGPDTTDDTQTGPQTRMDTFTQASGWVITGVTVEPAIMVGSFEVKDVWAFLQACNKDNILYYKADGTATADEGATKCDQADPQQANAQWKFTNSGQTEFDLYGASELFSFSESDTLNFTITSLQIDAMTTTKKEDIENTEHTFTIKYKRN